MMFIDFVPPLSIYLYHFYVVSIITFVNLTVKNNNLITEYMFKNYAEIFQFFNYVYVCVYIYC